MMLKQICFLVIWHFLGVSNDASFGVLIPVNSTASGEEGTTILSMPADINTFVESSPSLPCKLIL